jgi:integrase
MRSQGYASGTVLAVAETAARLGAWMGAKHLEVTDLDETVLRLSLAPVLDPVGQCLQEWNSDVGLCVSQVWVGERTSWVQGFLQQVSDVDGQVCWDRVDINRANAYIAEAGQGYSLSSRHLVTAMRSLLAWAFPAELVSTQMSSAVLNPGPSRASLPQVLSARQVEAIKATADRSVPMGRRNYAMVVMISRLGLRVGEVAGLGLDDINWRCGQLTVIGKGGRVLNLPLPDDVGCALVEYLRDPRPAGCGRSVFLRSRPPLARLTGSSGNGVEVRGSRVGWCRVFGSTGRKFVPPGANGSPSTSGLSLGTGVRRPNLTQRPSATGRGSGYFVP